LDRYSNFYGGMYLWKMFGQTNIDVTDSELKQFFTHICNFVHDETGNWLNLSKVDELKILLNQVDLDKFKTNYYPQGIPQSVIDVFSGMLLIQSYLLISSFSLKMLSSLLCYLTRSVIYLDQMAHL
jgi:hypothetical protein